jgi:hypothetical protein
MSVLIGTLIVVVVVALACWIIHLIPFPPSAPAQLKPILMAFVAAVGLIVVLVRVAGII